MKITSAVNAPVRSKLAWSIAAAVSLSAGFANMAYAAEPTATDLEEVTVTGSRIQRRDFVSPNPITTIDAEGLERLGINNIGDAIIQVPQNISQFQPNNTGGSAFYVGSTLANLRGLNPFFGTRTLTLVDSHRFIPTTQGDAVDLNFIPSNLVARVESVTGGASAAYGSGAISGVVNVILDTRLQGVKIDADYGLTQESDGDNARFGIGAGTDFADGRGHIVVGGEFQTMDVIQSCADSRDWCAEGRGLYTNTAGFVPGANLPFTPNIPGQPHFMVVSGLRENQLSRGGVIFNNTPNATTTQQFDAAGTGLTTFNIGQQGFRAPGGQVVGGDGDRANTNVTLQPEVERKTFFSHIEYDFTDTFTGYAELSYGQVEGVNNQFGSGQNLTNTCIRPDNAYLLGLSAAVQAAVTARDGNAPFNANDNVICSTAFSFFPNGVPGTVITKNWQPQNLQIVSTDTEVTRGLIGARGDIGEWNWDAYYQFGETTRDQIGSGYRRNWAYAFATDAVRNSAGQIVCRVTRDGLPAYAVGVVDPIIAQGCQPLNTFGTANASPQALAYAFGSLTEHNVINQDVLAASINGQLWEGWGAGPLAAAFGVEWREDELSNDAGNLPNAIRTDFGLQYGDSFAGSTEVKEGYAEFEMPLVRDSSLADLLTLNAAVRTAQYETQGAITGAAGGSNTTDITTWKLAAVWDVNEWLRIRGSHSKDIRAPNFRELFYSQTIPAGGFFGTVQNPWVVPPPGGNNQDPTQWQLVGNTALEPEEAETDTIGFVIQPEGSNLQLSVDYYQIELEGGLALALGGPAAVTACFTTNDPFMCSLLTFGPARPDQAGNPNAARTNVTNMKTLYTNQNPYTAKGLDFAVNYQLDAADLFASMPGSFALGLAATHMIEQIAPVTRAGFVQGRADLAGQTGGDSGFLSDVAPAADWVATLAVTYLNGPFTGTLQTRFVKEGRMDMQNPKKGPDDSGYNPALSFSASDNNTPNYFVFNLNASYDLAMFDIERLQVFGSINNLLNKDPPFSTGGVAGSNAINFDTLGRTYRMGVRAKF